MATQGNNQKAVNRQLELIGDVNNKVITPTGTTTFNAIEIAAHETFKEELDKLPPGTAGRNLIINAQNVFLNSLKEHITDLYDREIPKLESRVIDSFARNALIEAFEGAEVKNGVIDTKDNFINKILKARKYDNSFPPLQKTVSEKFCAIVDKFQNKFLEQKKSLA